MTTEPTTHTYGTRICVLSNLRVTTTSVVDIIVMFPASFVEHLCPAGCAPDPREELHIMTGGNSTHGDISEQCTHHQESA